MPADSTLSRVCVRVRSCSVARDRCTVVVVSGCRSSDGNSATHVTTLRRAVQAATCPSPPPCTTAPAPLSRAESPQQTVWVSVCTLHSPSPALRYRLGRCSLLACSIVCNNMYAALSPLANSNFISLSSLQSIKSPTWLGLFLRGFEQKIMVFYHCLLGNVILNANLRKQSWKLQFYFRTNKQINKQLITWTSRLSFT